MTYSAAEARQHNSILSEINENITIEEYIQSISKHLNDIQAGGAGISRYPFLTQSLPLDLNELNINLNETTLMLHNDESKSTEFSLLYHPGYFHKASIKKIIRYYTTTLMSMCSDNINKIIDVEYIPQDEIDNILKKFSIPKYSFYTKKIDLCIHELIALEAANNPNNIAISHNNKNISFGELDDATNTLASVLIERGVSHQDNIAVMMDRTPSLIIAMLALFKVGAVYVPINPKYPIERTAFVIDNSNAKMILSNDANKLPDKHKDKFMLLSNDWQELPVVTSVKKQPQPDKKSIAYIIYTSGTTGKPKGVTIKHESLSNLTAWYQSCYQITKNDRASQFASQGFDTYICETLPILAIGASVHIVDDNIKLTPSMFFSWLVDNKITIGDLPTAYAQILFTMDWPENICLRMLKIGGETCTRYPDKKYSFDIWNVYGPTETTIEATYYKMHTANIEPNSTRQHKTPSIGKIIENGEAYIVDKYMKLLPIGIPGELLIGGICVSAGYYQRDDLTSTKFIDNLFNAASEYKLYRTGDLVCWRQDGNLEFCGRIDNQVKIRGYRIELGDIENILSKHPDVREVAVIAKESPNGDKSLVAYIVPNLDRERYPFQQRCLLSVHNEQFIEAITEDISKHGIALSGISGKIPTGAKVTLHLKLPGFNTGKDISARLIWQINNRAGFVFDLSIEEQQIITKCIDYFLSSHNIMDLVLSASAKRSLRKALAKKIPEYMVPSSFVSLMEFPLTFSGKVDLKALPPPDDYGQILKKQFIPASSATEKKLTEIWERILNKEKIGMEDNFFDVGGNSLKAAELSVNIMTTFNISIPAKILFDLSYIPILSEYIDTNGKQYNTQSYTQDEIDRDIILHENITPTGILSPNIDNPENILLTGAAGFLGVFMLNELLKFTTGKVYCLVRKTEFETVADRLRLTIKKFGLEDSLSLADRRIILVSSDLGLNKFGVSDDLYESLSSKIDTIFHCGAQVNIMASYNKLRSSNVQGTLEVIKFATHIQDKPINYVSTLSSAYLHDENGALTEEFPTKHYGDLFGGYAISKWVSERLLTELKDRGFPVKIYRSGYISGYSKSGHTSLNDALLLLIKGCIDLGFAPDMREKITILPVDFVSKAIVSLSAASPDQSNIYHIDHPTGIMWIDLVAWLNDYGYNIKVITMKEWKKNLQHLSQSNALYPFLPYYLSLSDDHTSPDVRTDKATEKLEKLGLQYPAINTSLLNLYFDYLCEQGLFTYPDRVTTDS